MKNIFTKIPFVLLLLMPFINGCEKEEILMSEDKISKQITHTWKKLFTPEETKIVWKFNEGKISIYHNENFRQEGTYSIDCSITKVKVKIDGFTGGYDFMNDTWQVISIDDVGLVITDLKKGIKEYEFVRED